MVEKIASRPMASLYRRYVASTLTAAGLSVFAPEIAAQPRVPRQPNSSVELRHRCMVTTNLATAGIHISVDGDVNPLFGFPASILTLNYQYKRSGPLAIGAEVGLNAVQLLRGVNEYVVMPRAVFAYHAKDDFFDFAFLVGAIISGHTGGEASILPSIGGRFTLHPHMGNRFIRPVMAITATHVPMAFHSTLGNATFFSVDLGGQVRW